jgi:tetratricopeptide (TPR) repeat protein
MQTSARVVLLSLGVVFTALTASGAYVQADTDTHNHTHYTESELAAQPAPDGALAPRLQNLGDHTFPVRTRNRDAQRFMNQGLNLAYAFNHAEAGRAFREAARLDPNLAMAYWGQALVLGPNINAPIDPANESRAYELIQQAVALKSRASRSEQGYIDALAQRYSGNPAERAERDLAYAQAMRELHERYPNDLDAATLYVEAMMDLRPWGYWMRDGTPHEGTAEIVALTERIIARDPRHPGALHLYIHLLEPTREAWKAEQAADTLLTLMPAAGHMVHMPAHIYQRVGRYADAIHSNELAILADEDYITQCQAQGLYPMGYYPHNIHFLWFAATFDGQSALAIDSARKLAAGVPDEALAEVPMLAIFRVTPYFALTRFGHWQEMLAEPPPPAGQPFLQSGWHYARGLSLLATGRVSEAEAELAALNGMMSDPGLDAPLFSPNTGRAVMAVAPQVLAGEIAATKGDFDSALLYLERAVRLEEALVYTEPAEWHYPVRHALGAVLLQAGRPGEAETVYWSDLARHPDNGWALYGLMQALSAQGKQDEAALIQARFLEVWARADFTPTASRLGGTRGGQSLAGTVLP